MYALNDLYFSNNPQYISKLIWTIPIKHPLFKKPIYYQNG